MDVGICGVLETNQIKQTKKKSSAAGREQDYRPAGFKKVAQPPKRRPSPGELLQPDDLGSA